MIPPVRPPIPLTLSVAEHHARTTKSLGIQHVTEGLLATLAGRSDIALRVLASPAWAGFHAENPQAQWQDFNYPCWNRFGRIWWDQVGVYGAMRARSTEWLLLTKGFAPFRPPPCRLAVLIHDAMHDHYRRHHPGDMPAGESLYFMSGLNSALRRAKILFTISRFTAQEINRILDLGTFQARPQVVYAGIGFRPSIPRVGPRKRTEDLLVYSSVLPHKLTGLAVRYLEQWQREVAFGGTIHWVGNWPTGRVIPQHAHWIRHGRISDEHHEQLLSTVRVSVFFSEYEGFGMPPVEAALHGASPVYSDIAATREVMGSCGCRFSNDQYASFYSALETARTLPSEIIDIWREELLARHNWADVGERIWTALKNAEG